MSIFQSTTIEAQRTDISTPRKTSIKLSYLVTTLRKAFASSDTNLTPLILANNASTPLTSTTLDAARMPSTALLSPFTAVNTQKNPSANSLSGKKWRWWNFLTVFLVILIIIEFFVLISSYNIFDAEFASIRIVKRQYPIKNYAHLNTSVQSQIERGTRVYHVTKEFGPATITELGRTVTALAAAQQASNITEVAIVMPFYTFMRQLITDKEIDMVIDIRGKRPGQVMSVEFRVWKMLHVFNPPVQLPSKYEWRMINNVNISVLITPQRPPQPTDVVPVYMIGQANRKPFSQAFKCKFPHEIYNENELPSEWREQFFAKAAATFLAHKATASDEESIFAPIRIVPRVDIVHTHGASNGYVAKYLQDKKEADDLGPRPPAIVHTIHDHENDMRYQNSFRSVRKFLEQMSEREKLRKYMLGSKVYMSQLAIDRSDAITFTSQSLAADIVEGRLDFHLKELVMDSLLKKVDNSRFYGINSAIDFHSSEHPFITDKLINRKMGYPQFGWELIKNQSFMYSQVALHPFRLEIPNEPTQWRFSYHSSDFVFVAKDKAKRYLIRHAFLSEPDMKRPVVLYRGSFSKDNTAALDSLLEFAPIIVKNNMRLIILGSHQNYSRTNEIENLSKTYPNNIKISFSAKERRLYGVFSRAAADFVISPDHSLEKLGNDRAEGLAFGSAVIAPAGSSRLFEALVDRSHNNARRHVDVTYADPDVASEKGAAVISYEYYNAYTYTHGDIKSMSKAIIDATHDYANVHRKSKTLREEYVLRMIRSAFNLGWDKGHFRGPVHEYNQVYEMALKDRFIPEMKRHEVEQEHELVSRLQDFEPFDWED